MRQERCRWEAGLPAVVPLAAAGLLAVLWLAGVGGDVFLAAAVGLVGAFVLFLWLGPRLVAEWPGPRPGAIWPDQAALALTAWYLLVALFAASPARAAAGALAALAALALYFLGRYLGALWLPGREAAGWGPPVWTAALLAGLGLVLHALGLTPAAGWPGSPPLTALGDLVVPPPSGFLADPRVPAGLAATGRLAAVIHYPNAAGALFLAGLVGASWLLARAWKGEAGQPAGPLFGRGFWATGGCRALAGFLLVAGLALSFSRGAWVLWPLGLLALALLLPPGEALLTTLAGGLLWALGLVFLLVYLPALAAGGALAGLAVLIVAGGLAWLTGERLGPRLKMAAEARARPWAAPAVVAALAAATALTGFLLPREAAFRLAWPRLTGAEVAAWLGRLRDGLAAVLGRPLLGAGPGGWTVVAPAFRQAPYVSLEPQNLFLKLGVEAGLPGLLLGALVAGGAVVALAPVVLRRRQGGLTAAWVAVTLLVVHGLVDYAVGYPPLTAYFFLLLGLTWGLGVRAVLGPDRKPAPAAGRPRPWMWAVGLVLALGIVALGVALAGRGLEAVGEGRLAAGRPESARVAFTRATRLNPLSSGAFWGLARAHLLLAEPGNLEQALPAIASAGQTMRLDPGNPAYHSLAGQVTVGYGFTDIGLRALERARELDPVARDHWENLVWGYARAGQGYEQAGDRARAEAAYLRAVGWATEVQAYFGPVEQGRANLALGVAFLRLGQFTPARDAFRRALDDPRAAGEAADWLKALGDR